MDGRSSKRAKGSSSKEPPGGGTKGQDVDANKGKKNKSNSDDQAHKDAASMSVKELKEMLKARGIDTSDCLEKADLLAKLEKNKGGKDGEPVVVSKFFASPDVPKLTKCECPLPPSRVSHAHHPAGRVCARAWWMRKERGGSVP